MMKSILISVVALLLLAPQLNAQVALTNVSESDLESIVKEVGANFHQISLVKANSSENPYEIGLISGGTNSKTLNQLAGGSTLSSIPHAAIFGAIFFNPGLTFEASYLPTIKAQDVKLTSGKVGLKWTANHFFQTLPVNISVMGFLGTSQVTWQQTIATVLADMKYSQNFMGANLQVSKNFMIFEPYGVLGYSNNSGEISASGTASIFNTSFTASNTADKKVSGLNYAAGLIVNQSNLSYGLEIGSYYGVQVNSLKMSALF